MILVGMTTPSLAPGMGMNKGWPPPIILAIRIGSGNEHATQFGPMIFKSGDSDEAVVFFTLR